MENRLKNAFVYSFMCHGEYLKDLIIINTKCLVDDKNERSVYIDYKRLRAELVFYKYYGEKYNESVYNLNFILPIILCNSNMKNSEKEIIKNISYYCRVNDDKRKYEYILVGVAYNYLMHSLIKDSKINVEVILDDIKKYIIGFGLDEKLEKSEVIGFERSRIYFIQKIDKFFDKDLNKISEDSIVDGFLRVLYQIYVEDFEEVNEELKSLKNSVLGILDFKFDDIDNDDKFKEEGIENIGFIRSLSEYVLKIRKYEINKKIYEESAHPRELISLNVGDSVYSPILNNVRVVDKNMDGDILHMKIRSKSGEYNFRFRKS